MHVGSKEPGTSLIQTIKKQAYLYAQNAIEEVMLKAFVKMHLMVGLKSARLLDLRFHFCSLKPFRVANPASAGFLLALQSPCY